MYVGIKIESSAKNCHSIGRIQRFRSIHDRCAVVMDKKNGQKETNNNSDLKMDFRLHFKFYIIIKLLCEMEAKKNASVR